MKKFLGIAASVAFGAAASAAENGSVAAPQRVLRAVDMEAALSRDGALAFASNRSGAFEIYRATAAGADLFRLTKAGGAKDTPAWSPDSSRLVFVDERDGNADIHAIDRDGGALQRLTSDPRADMHPNWSPDGARIIFTRFDSAADGGAGRLDVYGMNADGKSEKRLMKGASYASLSPDGKSLVYWRFFGENADICISDANGKHQRRLTTNAAFDGWPYWSPDGKRVAFARETEEGADIFIIDVESLDETRITGGPGRKTSPKWSADGAFIYFDGVVDGAQGLWKIAIAP